MICLITINWYIWFNYHWRKKPECKDVQTNIQHVQSESVPLASASIKNVSFHLRPKNTTQKNIDKCNAIIMMMKYIYIYKSIYRIVTLLKLEIQYIDCTKEIWILLWTKKWSAWNMKVTRAKIICDTCINNWIM